MITVSEKPNTKQNRIASIDQETYFVPVVDGKEINCIGETYDMALLLGLEYKYQGCNSQFAKFAGRMLGIESVWTKQDGKPYVFLRGNLDAINTIWDSAEVDALSRDFNYADYVVLVAKIPNTTPLTEKQYNALELILFDFDKKYD